jgi:hypothetical protein
MDTTQTPAEQEPKTRITTVSVRVKCELDAGYLPFMRFMKKQNWKKAEFGMRDATRHTVEAWMNAEVGDDMTADEAIQMLSSKGHTLVMGELRREFPEAFPRTQTEAKAAPEIPEEAYVISSTTIERQTTGDF